MMINVIQDDLFKHIGEYDAIVIGTNTCYSMRHGIQRQVSLKYPYVFNANLKTKYGDKSKLGTFIECKEQGKPTFLLCFITDGINTRPDIKKDTLSYESLEKCLQIINIVYKGKNLASYLLGVSRFDGCGDKDKIFDIFKRNIKNLDMTIYDYKQKSRDEMLKEIYEKEMAVKKNDINEYYEMVKKRKEREEKIKELNGHAKK